jgi:hypothetical protein
VPVDFLTRSQLGGYGRYCEPPSAAQLDLFFHVDERDRALIDRRRGDHNRLGFAVQLGTVRFLGTFLARPAEVPQVVAARVAEELRVNPGCLTDYAKREQTHREHAGEIQREYGYRDFSEASAQAELLAWLERAGLEIPTTPRSVAGATEHVCEPPSAADIRPQQSGRRARSNYRVVHRLFPVIPGDRGCERW